MDHRSDGFRLEVPSQGDVIEVPCEEQRSDGQSRQLVRELFLDARIGQRIALAAELTFEGEPVTVRHETCDEEECDGESAGFVVQPGGADVTFTFELEDFFYTGDLGMLIQYRNPGTVPGTLADVGCDTAGVTTQRITLTRADGSDVPGAEACYQDGEDEVCVPADGTAAPCQDGRHVIKGIGWGRYSVDVEAEAPEYGYVSCLNPIPFRSSPGDENVAVVRTDTPCSQ